MLTTPLIWWQQCTPIGKFFLSPGYRLLMCLRTEVHKRREMVRGGRQVDARQNCTTSKVIMLFVCGCYERELCLRVIRGVFIPLNYFFFKRKQTEWNWDKRTWICPTETLVYKSWTNVCTLDQLDAGKSVQGGIECVNICYLDYSHFSRPVHLRCKLSFIGCGNSWWV